MSNLWSPRSRRLGLTLLVCWWLAPLGVRPARAEAPPPPPSAAEELSAAADELTASLEAASVPWPARLATGAPEAVRERAAAVFAARWPDLPLPGRSAYASLAFCLAQKSDEWEQVSGGMGAPHTDAYFAALTPLSGRVLLAVDGLRRLLTWLKTAPASGEDAGPAPSWEGPTSRLRQMLAGLPPAPPGEPLTPLLGALGDGPSPRQVRLTRDSTGLALTCDFPTVRPGAELALLLTLLAGQAVAAEASAPPPRVLLLLHEQGLPRLDVEMPGDLLAGFLGGECDLAALWASWQVVDYTEGLALSAPDLLLQAPEVPPDWTLQAAHAAATSAALSVAGLAPPSAPGITSAATQEADTPLGKLHLAALVGEDPVALDRLRRGVQGEPASAVNGTVARLAAALSGLSLDLEGPQSGPLVTALIQGRALYLLNGPAEAVRLACRALSRVWVSAQQPEVQVPPAVRASLTGQPAPSSVAPTPTPAASLEPFTGPGVIQRAEVCLGVDEHKQPRGVGSVFPAGVEELSLYLEFADMPPNSQVELQWRHEGQVFLRQILVVTGRQRALTSISNQGGGALGTGSYEVLFVREGRLARRVAFRIE